MFQLSVKDIHPGERAANKDAAIRLIAEALTQSGNVAPGYVEGMLAREKQTSTYLGSGIAIPHGTTDTRDKVLKTGVQVFQFPEGVAWDDGQMAYIAIGIAASSDEHLSLLRQLTHVLSDDAIAQQLRTATDAQTLRELLMGEKQNPGLIFDASTLSLDVAASDLVTLQALNAGRLNATGAVDATFVSSTVSQPPLCLGQGVWLSDSTQGNRASGIAIARPSAPFTTPQGEVVTLLMTVAVTDEAPLLVLNRLSDLLTRRETHRLLNADASALLTLLTSETLPPDTGPALAAEFVIRNEHGLHARPGTMLVNTIKQYKSEITVANLDGTGKAVNGRSLMKVVALGVKKGHRLRFNASGEDAVQALEGIGNAISDGLGEGKA